MNISTIKSQAPLEGLAVHENVSLAMSSASTFIMISVFTDSFLII